MSSPMSRSHLRTGVVSVAALALVAALGWQLMTDADPDASTTIRATMADAAQLEEGAQVRASGVLVGEVSSIELKARKADVTLEVDEGVLPIHEDATLTIEPINLLGEVFVSLDPGSGDRPFMDEAVIPVEQTSISTTLQDVLNTLDSPKAAQLAAVLTALGEGMSGNGANAQAAIKKLAPALADAGELGDVLSQQSDVLAELLRTVDPVAAALADDGGRTLDRLVASTTATLSAVARQQAALGATLEQLPATLTSAQRTLAELGGVSRAALPTLRSLRPITGNLEEVVDELERFADSADPALASLEPVLAEADKLIGKAAPVVRQLRLTGPDLATTASSLRPLARQLLRENLHGVMEFVRKWSLSTNGRDSLSHYFRGVVYLTPEALETIATSLIPPQLGLGGEGQDDNPIELPDLGDVVPDVLSGAGLDGLLSGLLKPPAGPKSKTTRTQDGPGALGLTGNQESALFAQLLGGGN